jgi:DNA topoisomerase-1
VARTRRPDAPLSASAARLRYVTDSEPGFARARRGKEFIYRMPGGQLVRRRDVLHRIRTLAIPPAWTDVWICASEHGHVQATGRDARGRKQYRYHPRWRQVRDEAKFERLIDFARTLPTVRARTQKDLARPGLSKSKVIAAIIQLLERTMIRVGNDEYARENGSFGLTTLQDKHVQVLGAAIRFRFRGKSGRFHTIPMTDRRLARIVRQCQELPGRELFQYVDEEGQVQDIGSGHVNEYLRETTGHDFTAKDFRTWGGTVLAAQALLKCPPCTSAAQANRSIVVAVDAVAGILGNTRAVCRKCYIHPAIVEAYADGSLSATLGRAGRGPQRSVVTRGLSAFEQALLALLRRRASTAPVARAS